MITRPSGRRSSFRQCETPCPSGAQFSSLRTFAVDALAGGRDPTAKRTTSPLVRLALVSLMTRTVRRCESPGLGKANAATKPPIAKNANKSSQCIERRGLWELVVCTGCICLRILAFVRCSEPRLRQRRRYRTVEKFSGRYDFCHAPDARTSSFLLNDRNFTERPAVESSARRYAALAADEHPSRLSTHPNVAMDETAAD